ncbi:MAG TPA: TetR/AcrR family transcriptional regulator, partial [Candidatus Ventrimonas merdavium]|nr:TetR/AcrR family transcriptional regulator [Candidatus Ventrimonas merdavium]
MDIRIKKTKNSIINAFLELRAQKSIEKITVKELCEKAMVNKSTFYSHFSDLYALSEYLEIQLTNEILEEIEHPETLFSQPEEFNKQLIYAFLSHERLIQTLFSGSR